MCEKRIGVIRRGTRDAHTRTHVVGPAVEVEGSVERFEATSGDLFGFVNAAVFADYDEFIAAKPCQRVGGTHDRRQALGDIGEHGVPLAVPSGVVDGLEGVQVEEDDRHVSRVAVCSGESQSEAVIEEHPVRQASERVVKGLVFQAFRGAQVVRRCLAPTRRQPQCPRCGRGRERKKARR